MSTLGIGIAARHERQKINLVVIGAQLSRIALLGCLKGCREMVMSTLLLSVIRLRRSLVHKSCNTRLNSSLGDAYIVRVYGRTTLSIGQMLIGDRHLQRCRIDVIRIQLERRTGTLLNIDRKHTVRYTPILYAHKLGRYGSTRFSLLEYVARSLDIVNRNNRRTDKITYSRCRLGSSRDGRTLSHTLRLAGRGHFPSLVGQRLELDSLNTVDVKLGNELHTGQTTRNLALEFCNSRAYL